MTSHFTSPPDMRFFQVRVWEVARLIPPGKVATYGQIAALLPPPGNMDPKAYLAFGPRWVGGAMAGCPGDVPWQRVINAQGKISSRQGSREQHKLLEDEGVVFDARERIDLARFAWQGPSPEWLRDNGLNAPDEPQQLSLL